MYERASCAGASSDLQQILACNSEAAATILASTLQQPGEALLDASNSPVKNSLGPGDYVVLQAPLISGVGVSHPCASKKAIKKPEWAKTSDTLQVQCSSAPLTSQCPKVSRMVSQW